MDLTGIVPAGDEPKVSRRVPEHGRVRQRPNEVRELVAQIFTRWNRIAAWLTRLQALQRAA